MSLNAFLYLFICLCLFQISSSDDSFSKRGAIPLIRDVLNFQKWPTFVNGFLCWDKETLVELTKELSGNGYRSNVFMECETDKSLFPDHASLFIIDLNCPFSLHCLKNAELSRLFETPYRWLMLSTSSDQESTKNTLVPLEFQNFNPPSTQESRNEIDTTLNTEIFQNPSTNTTVPQKFQNSTAVFTLNPYDKNTTISILESENEIITTLTSVIFQDSNMNTPVPLEFQNAVTSTLEIMDSIGDSIGNDNTADVVKFDSEEVPLFFSADYKDGRITKDIQFPGNAENFMFKNCSMLCDSEVVYAKLLKGGKFKLTQIYKRRPNETIVEENFGLWENSIGITGNNLRNVTAIRRLNLQRTVLGASVVINANDTIANLRNYGNKKVDTVTKANFILVTQLIDIVNGTPNFIWEDSWGYKLADGTWSGMIGTMIKGGSDIAGTPLFFTAERMPVVDYIVMTTPTIAKFIFRQPPLSYVSNLFLLPFRWTVWVASTILIMLIILAIYSIALWEEKKPNRKKRPKVPCSVCGIYDCDLSHLQGKIADVSMLAVGAISQQGSTEEPKSLPGRISTLVMFIVLMFLYNAYSANIVALLQSQSDSIKTLADLLHSRFKMGVHDNLYNRYFFPAMTEPIRKAIWEQKVAPKGTKPRFMELEEGVEEMRKGLFAFHVETGVCYQVVSDTFLEEEKCGLVEIPYLLEPYPWFTIQKNSSFKEIFKIGTRRILEAGLQSRQIQRLYTKKPTCNGGGAGFISVGINEIRPALVWLCAGFVVAIALLIFEKLSVIRCTRFSRNPDGELQDTETKRDAMWTKKFENEYRAKYND